VFVNKGFTKRINGVTRDESDLILGHLFSVRSLLLPAMLQNAKRHTNINGISQLVTHNHDAQVRLKWNKNDLAIWDNRSNWHCATYDYDSARAGDRVCSLGEAPYLDLNSKSRREALAERAI